MNTRIPRLVRVLGCAACLAGYQRLHAETAGTNRPAKPAILFLGGSLDPGAGGNDTHKNMLRLDAQGYRVAHYTYGTFDPASLKPFDVIVVMSYPFALSASSSTFPFNEIRDFLSDGGGVLLFSGHWLSHREWDAWLAPLGVNLLTGCYADAQALPEALGYVACAYTTQIAPGPLTQGVSGFWYPVRGSTDNLRVTFDCLRRTPNTEAFDVDANWNVLASGAPTTVFHAMGQAEGCDLPELQAPRRVTMARAKVPLLAVRDGVQGKGRLAVCGLDAVFTDFMQGNTVFEGTFTGKGMHGKRSDLDRLLMNVVAWLGEGSVKAGRPTIAATRKETLSVSRFTFPEPLSVGDRRPMMPRSEAFDGFIGARSTISGGASTVAEYAAAARELGLQYLIFLEDYETLDDTAFEAYQAECAAHSDDRLVLIPGYRIQTDLGVHYFGYRQGLKLPLPSMLRTGTRKLAQQSGLMAFGQYAWVQANGYRFKMGCGNFRLAEKYPSGVPPEDYNHHNPFISLFTYQNGQLADSLMETYLKCAARTEWVSPMAVNLVDSVAALRREWKSDHFKTVYLRPAGGGIGRFNEDIGDMPGHQPITYVTNGPRIEEWRNSGFDGDGGWWDWTRYRWFVRMVVSSDAGLGEIQVMDGLKPVYRFLPRGAKRFEQELVLTHNDMHNLILVVTDEQGRRAISDELWDKNMLFQLSWCIDRNNMNPVSLLPAPKAPDGLSAGYAAPHNLEKGAMREHVLPSINQDRSAVAHFDGQPYNAGFVNAVPWLFAADGAVVGGSRIARDIGRQLSAPDAAIQTAACRLVYPASVSRPNPWTRGPLVPLEHFQADIRYITFSHAGHDPAPVLVEGTIKILKDTAFARDRRVGVRVMTMKPHPLGGYQILALQHSRTGNRVFSLADMRGSAGAFNTGAYFYMFPSKFGAAGVISLTDDLVYGCNSDLVEIGFANTGQTLKAGTELRYRVLAFIAGFDEEPSTRLPERLRTMLGMDGAGGTAYTVTAEQGRVTGTEYVLRLDGAGQGFAGRIALPAAMPAALPIIVENLNARWSSVLYDRDRKRFRPLGMHGNQAYCHRAPAERDGNLFIGHPFTASDTNLWISVVQTRDDEVTVQVNNPTDRATTTRLTPSPYFDFVKGEAWDASLAAGTMAEYLVTPRGVRAAGAQP